MKIPLGDVGIQFLDIFQFHFCEHDISWITASNFYQFPSAY